MRLKKKAEEGGKHAAAGFDFGLRSDSMMSLASQTFSAPVAAEQVEQEDEIGLYPETPLGSFVEMRR